MTFRQAGLVGVVSGVGGLEALEQEIGHLLGTASLVEDLRAAPGRVGPLEEVARYLKGDPKTVSNRSRRRTRCFFRDFMHHCRVREAGRVLADSELEAKEIASRVGFRSYGTFGRVFVVQKAIPLEEME